MIGIMPSAIHGLGIFALDKIRINKCILNFNGKMTPYSKASSFGLGLKNGYALDNGDERPRTIDDFLNHSTTPNCKVDLDTLCLFSLRDIEIGEELTIDYSLTEESDWIPKTKD